MDPGTALGACTSGSKTGCDAVVSRMGHNFAPVSGCSDQNWKVDLESMSRTLMCPLTSP